MPEPSDPSNNHNSLLPLAQELADAVGARLRGEEVPTSASIEGALDAALADAAHGLITARLARLPAVEFAELYVRVLGSEALKSQLDELTVLKSAELERYVRIRGIRDETQASGILRIERLQPDEIIKIGLFDPELPQFAAKSHAKDERRRPLHRVIAVRAVIPSERRVEVLYDNWVGPAWADAQRTAGLPPLGQGTFGERLALHVPPVYRTDDQEFRLRQVVGYVELNDGTVLLDGGPRVEP